MGPDTFIRSRREAIAIEDRHANEMRVYDDMADQVLAEWTDDDYAVDADALPECHQFEGPMQQLIDWSQPLEGATVLETGSGFGELSCWLALHGANVIATDISSKCLDVVAERARRNGVEDRIRCVNTPIEEAAGIDDESVDLVFGRTVAHHFDLGPAAKSMYRALKPGGRAVFAEPVLLLGDWVFRLRRSKPVTKVFPPFVHTPDERSFDHDMIADLSAPFDAVEIEYFGIFTRVSSFVRVPDTLYHRVSALDQAILDRVVGARSLSKYMVIRLDKSAQA
ncbi:MAG: class I SAM-dependent methyltransferase [Actinobacteria bacterium]|nr:class I SAM-dependent methyltransferase [Actinomycetota bacterium]